MTRHLNDNLPSFAENLRGRKFVFAGNRSFVLEEIIARDFPVEVFAVRGSWLERELRGSGRRFSVIESRNDLVVRLTSMDFDVFVSNGCPYILPVSKLKDRDRIFVNVHPGPLPDLRGLDPVPGALLLGRDSGAACHLMDDGIDTGPIISRVVIPNTEDLDAGLLYQMSFMAEKEAFSRACERGFRPAPEAGTGRPGVYYSKKPEDLRIDFGEAPAAIVRRVKAFSNRSQGARFSYRGSTFRVFDAEPVVNPWLMRRRNSYAPGEVVFRYEDCLLVRLGEGYLKLKAIEGDLSAIRPGDRLGAVEQHAPAGAVTAA
ncbi:MAG: formyltransferase family protein [Alphaproteobacteria bacterium]